MSLRHAKVKAEARKLLMASLIESYKKVSYPSGIMPDNVSLREDLLKHLNCTYADFSTICDYFKPEHVAFACHYALMGQWESSVVIMALENGKEGYAFQHFESPTYLVLKDN